MPLKPRLSALESNGTGGGGGLPPAPQIMNVNLDIPQLSIVGGQTYLILTVGAIDYTYIFSGISANMELSINNFITNNAADILANTGYTISYAGPFNGSSPVTTGVLQFTGPDEFTEISFSKEYANGSVQIVSFEEIQAASTIEKPQSTLIGFVEAENGTPPAAGTIDIDVTVGATLYTYTLTFTTGDVKADLDSFIATQGAQILSDTGFTATSKDWIPWFPAGTFRPTSEQYSLLFTGPDNSTTATFAFNNDTLFGVVYKLISNETLAQEIPTGGGGGPATVTFGYGNGVILYGYSKAGKDYITILERKKFPKVIEVDDLNDILSTEFLNTIYVTAISGETLALNADKIISVLPKGTGSIVRYYSDGFGLKDFQVTEAPSAIELDVDALV